MEGQHRQDFDPTRRNVIIGVAAVAAGAGALGVAALGKIEGWWGGDGPEAHPTFEGGTQGGITLPETTNMHLPEAFNGAKHEKLITDSWYLLGAKPGPNGSMDIKASGFAIRKVDDDGYIPNPPIMRSGPRVDTNGNDFGIAARISNVTSEKASLFFHSKPDITLDEDLFHMPGIGVSVQGGRITIDVWDGKLEQPDDTFILDAKAGGDHTDIWVRQEGGKVIVGSGAAQKVITTSMFKKSKQVLFGADGDFRLDTLDVYATGNGPVEVNDTSKRKLPDVSPNGLQGIARAHGRNDLIIGTAIDLGSLDSTAPLMEHVGGLKPEMLAKMQAVLPGGPDKQGNLKPEDFNWQEVDAFVDLAKRNGRAIEMHTLIFGEAMSEATQDFLRDCAKRGDKAAAQNFMEHYIKAFVGRYKNDVHTWDVVNEPMADTGDDDATKPREHDWFKAFGNSTEYIAFACKTAKEAGAKRVRINENGLETDKERRQAFIDIVKPIAANGWADAVGLQAHLDLGKEDGENSGDIADYFNDDTGRFDASYAHDEIKTVFKEFAAAGLEADITEFSIDISDDFAADREKIQGIVAAGYGAAIMESPTVKIFSTWGLETGPFYMTSERNSDGSFSLGNDAPWGYKAGQPVPRPAYVGGMKAGLRGEI